jgi:ubiquinone biosynthesis protein COQ4
MAHAAETLDNAAAGRPAAANPRRNFSLQPLRAARAVGRLMADKEDTGQVFEIMRALAGKAVPKGYRKLLSTPDGGRIAYEREEFADRLSDGTWLASFAPGTVGAAYREFVAPRGLTAEGLANESRKVADMDIDAAHPLAWYARRTRDVHDVWHVLSGYGTDALGEACLVAFSYSQTKNLGFAAIALGAGREFARQKTDQPYGRAIREGLDNGRKAAWLQAVDYPALFAEPLEAARARLRIATPVFYASIPVDMRDRMRGA